MNKKKGKKKRAYNRELKPISIKLGHSVLARIKRNAKRHAEGNLSAWLRNAGLNYKPKKGERFLVRAG